MTHLQNISASTKNLATPSLARSECTSAYPPFRSYRTSDVTESHPTVPVLDQVEVAIDGSICWAFLRPVGLPCFTPELLSEIRALQTAIRTAHYQQARAHRPPFKYVVLGSRIPGVFSLGGDLELFCHWIRAGDREKLQSYADLCVDAVYQAATRFDLPVITIALVQGDALGGGFEAALACDLIIAETSAKIGLPEVLFNLFPGMGAYNFLSRRLDPVHAERIILSGKVYSADEMHALGIVDLVVEDGSGEDAVRDYVARNLRRHQAERAIYWARQRFHPVQLSDLRALASVWVDTALSLTEMDLRKMARLMTAQSRRTIGRALALASPNSSVAMGT